MKEPQSGKQVREGLKRGIDKAADLVKSTLGAGGRLVSIRHKNGYIQTTKDGVTVAREIRLEDPLENMGADFLKEAAGTTVIAAGDGTTLTSILLQALVRYGMEAMEKRGFREVTQEIQDGVVEAISYVRSVAKQADSVDILEAIATISANGDKELAKEISLACWKAGKDGVVMATNGDGIKTRTEYHEGFQVPAFNNNPVYVTNPQKFLCELENALVLCVDFPLEKQGQITEAMKIAKNLESPKDERPLVLVTPLIDGEARPTFERNVKEGRIKGAVLEIQGSGEDPNDWIRDIAMLSGAKVFSRSGGDDLAKLTKTDLGVLSKVTCGLSPAIVIGNPKEEVKARYVEGLKGALESTTDAHRQHFLKQRIAGLSGGVHIIHVGGTTANEISERKDRADDAVAAVRSAQEEGYVPGGHTVFACASHATKSVLMQNVLISPFKQLLDNAGLDPKEYLINSLDTGVDVRDGEVKDMKAAGIIDPAKVLRVALGSAAGIAIQVLKTDGVVLHD